MIKEDFTDQEEYFYTLVRPKTPRRSRHCLKCRISFLSKSFGNRTCGSCAAQNARAPKMSGYAYE